VKEIKKILFVHRVERPVNPLFEAIMQRAVLSDSVLSTAGLCIDSAEIGLPQDYVVEEKKPLPEVQSILDSMGCQSYSYRSKDIRSQSSLIDWADLILVPDLGTEDLLCMFSHEAWSKTIEISVYCGKKHGGADADKLSDGNSPKSTDDYISIATTFKMLLPELINRIKDSYASHLIVKGRLFVNNKTAPLGATVTGNASVVMCGGDLLNFTPGNILIADRLGAILKSEITQDISFNVINKLAKSPEFYDSKTQQMKDVLENFKATIESEKKPNSIGQAKQKVNPSKVEKFFPDGDNAIAIVVRNAKAIVCSRGVGGMHYYDIPYVYTCIGATEHIKDNQLIVVDSARGEVYDAVTLRRN